MCQTTKWNELNMYENEIDYGIMYGENSLAGDWHYIIGHLVIYCGINYFVFIV